MDMKKVLENAEIAYKLRHKSPIRAPGIVIGAAMVELGLNALEEGAKLCIVAEAKACLTDAVQALTGCTVGNKYLKIYDEIGRYAISMYDRNTGKGVRVFVDLEKIKAEDTPELHKFFHRKRDPKVQTDLTARAASGKLVVEEFVNKNHDIFGVENILVKDLEKDKMLAVKVCPSCKESFTYEDEKQEQCLVCSKALEYYTKA
jgi:formylmethanofuran dehydrogenase subunit E